VISFRSILFAAALLASFGLWSVGSSSAAQPVESTAAIESALDARDFGVREPDATSSSRKRPKFMPMYKARNNAKYAAYQIYLDPEFNFDRYGTGSCRRLNRSTVYCYTWASEDYYDDFGYYVDTMLCDWFTTSSYNRRGRMKIKIEQPECVWVSEI
jgi:hypothetical protein